MKLGLGWSKIFCFGQLVLFWCSNQCDGLNDIIRAVSLFWSIFVFHEFASSLDQILVILIYKRSTRLALVPYRVARSSSRRGIFRSRWEWDSFEPVWGHTLASNHYQNLIGWYSVPDVLKTYSNHLLHIINTIGAHPRIIYSQLIISMISYLIT